MKSRLLLFYKTFSSTGDVVEKEGVVLNQVRNTPEGASRLKSHHYLNNILGNVKLEMV